MIPQFHHHRDDFFFDFPGEILSLRVECASHDEILPHENSVLIAQVEEIIVLVNISAPAADYVAVQIHRHVDGFRKMSLISTVQCIKWHPVRAMRENPFPIHDEAELSRGIGQVYLVPLQSDGSQAYSFLVLG